MNSVCSLCGQQFTDRKGFSKHLTVTHKNFFSSKLEKEQFLVYSLFGKEIVVNTVEDYLVFKYCTYLLPINISKYLTLLNIKRSSKEERLTFRYKSTYLKGLQKKYGEDIFNISQIEEVKIKKKEKILQTFPDYNSYINKKLKQLSNGYKDYKLDSVRVLKTHNKYIETCLDRYGCDNVSKDRNIRKKIGITNKKILSLKPLEERQKNTLAARTKFHGSGAPSSKIEKRVQIILSSIGIKFITNKMLLGYNWDILFKDNNFLLEVQGDYWHGNPLKYTENDIIEGVKVKDTWEKDRRKAEKAKTEGYKLLYIWENEIRSRNDSDLTNFIINLLVKEGFFETN